MEICALTDSPLGLNGDLRSHGLSSRYIYWGIDFNTVVFSQLRGSEPSVLLISYFSILIIEMIKK